MMHVMYVLCDHDAANIGGFVQNDKCSAGHLPGTANCQTLSTKLAISKKLQQDNAIHTILFNYFYFLLNNSDPVQLYS